VAFDWTSIAASGSGLSRREALALTAVGTGALLVGCSQTQTASKGTVIVVGAGLAGLGAASVLKKQGYEPIVLEARDRIGGRVRTIDHFGTKLDLGAAWIHDSKTNPLTGVAQKAGLQTVATDYDLVELRTGDGANVSSDSVDQAATAKDQILDAVDAAADSSPDATLQSVIGPLINDQDLSDEQAAALNWLLGVEIPLDVGAGPNEVSVEGFSEGSNLGGGPDLMIRGGAFQLVEAIAAGTKVSLSTAVTAITQSADGASVRTSTGETITADGCIITLPLGVLKAGGVDFGRALDQRTKSAISRISVGLLDKVFANYQQRWWPSETAQLGVTGAPIARTMSFFPLSAVTDKPLGVGFLGGSWARRLEAAGEQALVDAVVGRLSTGFGPNAETAQTLTTAWQSDPFSLGSYSYLGTEATLEERTAIGQLNGNVILAGEHTSINRPSTMDGAWLSGQMAARRLAQALN